MNEPLIIPPPTPKVNDYPVMTSLIAGIVFTTILVFVATRFDASGGVLTISIVIVLAFLCVTVFCLYFTIPSNEATSALIGGLTAAFGAIVAYWLGQTRGPRNGK